MKRMIHVAIIGDYRPQSQNQLATMAGLEHAAAKIDVKTKITWLPTEEMRKKTQTFFSGFDAYFGAPGAVVDVEGSLHAIHYARESLKPYLGSCAGFQYAILEFARNVVGLKEATSEEFNAHSPQLLLSRLSCSVVGKKMKVKILPHTLASQLYGKKEVFEEYYCNYGITASYLVQLTRAGIKISATDESGEPRIFELPNRKFYLATLFVPQISSTFAHPHPLLMGFLQAVLM